MSVPSTEMQQRVHDALRRGDRKAAVDLLTGAITSDPCASWAYAELIVLLKDARRIDEADQLAHKGLRHVPDDVRLHDLMGTVLSERNELNAGEWHFRRALELGGQDPDIIANLGLNLLRQGRPREAEERFAAADRLRPGDLRTLAHWSKACEVQHDLARADALLARAAAATSAGAVDLLRAQYLARAGDARAALAILEAAPALNGDAQLERGRLRDRLGRYEEAWQDFVEGKRKLAAEAGGLRYEAAAVERFFARLERFFVRDTLVRLPRATTRRDVSAPVFVVGFPRSGTTLLEQVLSNHPAIRAGGELPFLGELRSLANRLLPGGEPFPDNLAHAFTADYHHVAALFRDHYLARAETLGLLASGCTYFVDKMPFNEVWLPLAKMAFPQARIVRVVRHPLDVCVSIMSNHLNHGFNCGYQLADLARHLAAVQRLHAHYERHLDTGELILRYESFVVNPRHEIGRLLEYLGLPFDERCLRVEDNPRYAPTPSYAQVAEPLNDRSIGRYRNYAGPLAAVSGQLAPLLEAWSSASPAVSI